MQAFIVTFFLTLTYGGLHSFLAATQTKRVAKNLMGERLYEGWYRFIFNVQAVLLFIPIALLIFFRPGDTVWQVSGPLVVLFVAIQGAGLGGLLLSVAQIDSQRFLGLRQLQTWLEGRSLPLPNESLVMNGVYGLVRHPLYLFSLMLIWPVMTMSASLLGFNIGATMYFLVGSLLEENKLRQGFGATYDQYKQRVPWLLPMRWPGKSSTDS